jgi:hypothetical protein
MGSCLVKWKEHRNRNHILGVSGPVFSKGQMPTEVMLDNKGITHYAVTNHTGELSPFQVIFQFF